MKPVKIIDNRQAYVLYAELNGQVRPIGARSANGIGLATLNAEEAIQAVTGEDWKVSYCTTNTAVNEGWAILADGIEV